MQISDRILHQVSFVLGGQRRQFEFEANVETADRVAAALSLHLSGIDAYLDGGIQDLQVYPPLVAPASACSGVADILSAADWLDEADDPDDVKAVKALEAIAEEIDAASAAHGEAAVWTIEFVWCNGGGDDNCYGDSILAPPGAQSLRERFEAALLEALGSGVYDLAVVEEGRVAESPCGPHEVLEAVATDLEEHGLDDLAAAVAAAAVGIG